MEITSEGNAESQTTQFWLRARAAPPWCKSELALFLSQLLYLKHLEAMITHLSHKADQEMVAKPTNWGSFLGSYWKEQALRNKEQRWHTKRKGRLETLWAAHSCKTWPFRVGHVKGKRNTAPSSKIIAKFYINFKLFCVWNCSAYRVCITDSLHIQGDPLWLWCSWAVSIAYWHHSSCQYDSCVRK